MSKVPANYNHCPWCGLSLCVDTCKACKAELPAYASFCPDDVEESAKAMLYDLRVREEPVDVSGLRKLAQKEAMETERT